MTVTAAIEHLELHGYCVLENAIPLSLAERMAERYFQLHNGTVTDGARLERSADTRYETLFGLMNIDDLCWSCAAHPDVLAITRHFLGPEMRMAEACSKAVLPGGAAGSVHVDSAHDLPERLPEDPWLINTMWMITDFTTENGATLMAPFSHRARCRPPKGLAQADARLVPITGPRGSVVLWHAGVWHANGANTSKDQHRMGLNIAYYPVWWNLAREGGHQPILPEVFERMPHELQELNRHRVGRDRADVYEQR